MSRLLKPLSEWQEADVLALIQEQIEEGQRLEYKRELSLGSPSDKAEACKDNSGMANAVGGLLIYGVDEQQLPDGRRIPVGPTPIQDGGIEAQLQDVLYSSVSPRLNFATILVPASGGDFFLLVRVQPRAGALHMVEAHNQRRYFIRAGLATRPMGAHEVEAAFRELASAGLRMDTEVLDMPLVPRIAATRMRNIESGAVEPGEKPWVSVVVAPLDPGAELEMRTPSSSDFPALALHAQYLRDAYYLSNGNFGLDGSGYIDREADNAESLMRVLRLYRNGWCEWGYRYMFTDDPDGLRIPGLVLQENVHDALLYFAQTYADRGYFGRARIWIRIDNADRSVLIGEWPSPERTSHDEAISYETDTNVEQLLALPLLVVHAAMDRVWQGFGAPRCPYFSQDGELLKTSRT